MKPSLAKLIIRALSALAMTLKYVLELYHVIQNGMISAAREIRRLVQKARGKSNK